MVAESPARWYDRTSDGTSQEHTRSPSRAPWSGSSLEGLPASHPGPDRRLSHPLHSHHPLQLCHTASPLPSPLHPLARQYPVRSGHLPGCGSMRTPYHHTPKQFCLCPAHPTEGQDTPPLLLGGHHHEILVGMCCHLLYSEFPVALLVGMARARLRHTDHVHSGQQAHQVDEHQAGTYLHAELAQQRAEQR